MATPKWPGDHHDKHAAAARLGWRRRLRGEAGGEPRPAPAARVQRTRRRAKAAVDDLAHYETLARHMLNPPRFALALSQDAGTKGLGPGVASAIREGYSIHADAKRAALLRPEQVRRSAEMLRLDHLLHPVTGGRVLEPADRRAARARLLKLQAEERKALPPAIAAELKRLRAERKESGEAPAPRRPRKPVIKKPDAVGSAASELLAAQRAYAAEQNAVNRARVRRAQAAYRAVVPAPVRSERNEVERAESYAEQRRVYGAIGKRRAYEARGERIRDEGGTIGPRTQRVTRDEVRRLERAVHALRRGLAIRPVYEIRTAEEQARLRQLEADLDQKRAQLESQERARQARRERLTTKSR